MSSLASASLSAVPLVNFNEEVSAVLAQERKALAKLRNDVNLLEKKVRRDEKYPPKNQELVLGRSRLLTKSRAELEGFVERVEALEKGDFSAFPQLQAHRPQKRKAPEIDENNGMESDLTEPSDVEDERAGADSTLEAGRSEHQAKRRRAADASGNELEGTSGATSGEEVAVGPTSSSSRTRVEASPPNETAGPAVEKEGSSLPDDQRSATAKSEGRSIVARDTLHGRCLLDLRWKGMSSQIMLKASDADEPVMGRGKSAGVVEVLAKSKQRGGNKSARKGDATKGGGQGEVKSAGPAGKSADSKESVQVRGKGKDKAVDEDVEESGETSDESGDDDTGDEPYIYTEARQKKEVKSKLGITRYLETGGNARLKYGLRAHARERASHARRAGTSCYGLAFDCLVSRQKMVKCIYHRLVDKTTRKRDQPGQVLLGVPYPPMTSKDLKTLDGVMVNGYKLPVNTRGEAYCHCGCRLDDAVWGFFLWKSGRIEYNGDGHGYEVDRKPPTPAQRNFEITRLKNLGFELEDMWTHELVLGVYRELTPKQIFQRCVGRLLVKMKPALLLNGGVPEELDFTVAGGLFTMDDSDEAKLEENDG
ncbi:hypothetical protein V5O48_018230 [Marasmius crinis-equi]|uniref:Uncharacterized protein n=1 Tax=Marasmius crinis-equi TaxID=585013 RepID=A0ABR3ELS6_9AGAR